MSSDRRFVNSKVRRARAVTLALICKPQQTIISWGSGRSTAVTGATGCHRALLFFGSIHNPSIAHHVRMAGDESCHDHGEEALKARVLRVHVGVQTHGCQAVVVHGLANLHGTHEDKRTQGGSRSACLVGHMDQKLLALLSMALAVLWTDSPPPGDHMQQRVSFCWTLWCT